MEHTPKLKNHEKRGVHNWFPYYAGYSPHFVREVVQNLLPREGTLLDPWLGSGTTTVVSSSLDRPCIGYDVNPALTTVAKAKLAAGADWCRIQSLFEQWLAESDTQLTNEQSVRQEDPLLNWYTPLAAAQIRAHATALARLNTGDNLNDGTTPIHANGYSLDLLRLALFKTVRSYLHPFRTSNPTWIKIAKSDSEKIEVPHRDFRSRLSDSITAFNPTVHDSDGLHAPERPRASVFRADTRRIPLPDESIDGIVTSPPYCTRIDYIRATYPELAVLWSQDNDWITYLKDRMIGVTTTKNSGNEWEATAPYAATLTAIANHKSKASGKYYLRYFKSYFINIEESLREIRRVLRPRGKVVMVLQDSHYKDIHIDLVGIIRELASNLGLPSQVLHENRQTAPYSAIHPYRGRYRTSSIATESVILLGPP